VQPALAELDDRADHLLLFRLEDALLTATLDDQLQLLRADLRLPGDIRTEEARDLAGQPGKDAHERRQIRPRMSTARQRQRTRSGGKASVLGTSSPTTIVTAQHDRDDHDGEAEGMVLQTGTPAKARARRSARLTAAYAERGSLRT